MLNAQTLIERIEKKEPDHCVWCERGGRTKKAKIKNLLADLRTHKAQVTTNTHRGLNGSISQTVHATLTMPADGWQYKTNMVTYTMSWENV